MAVRYPNYELLDTVSVQLFMSYNGVIDFDGLIWYYLPVYPVVEFQFDYVLCVRASR